LGNCLQSCSRIGRWREPFRAVQPREHASRHTPYSRARAGFIVSGEPDLPPLKNRSTCSVRLRIGRKHKEAGNVKKKRHTAEQIINMRSATSRVLFELQLLPIVSGWAGIGLYHLPFPRHRQRRSPCQQREINYPAAELRGS
jgi:hypothetical protein